MRFIEDSVFVFKTNTQELTINEAMYSEMVQENVLIFYIFVQLPELTEIYMYIYGNFLYGFCNYSMVEKYFKI